MLSRKRFEQWYARSRAAVHAATAPDPGAGPQDQGAGAQAGAGAAELDPHVLELRIHGVNNTPPHGMLEVPAEDAEKVRGDSLGSFWTPTPTALAHARAVPETHQDHIPRAVQREAYSWGSMTRTSPSVPGNVAKGAVSAASRAGWMLLLPLGLVNVAYWSRALDETKRYARGARWIRVFGFGLSLLLVAAVADVSLDLVGTQCLTDVPGAGARARTCDALPSWLTWLAGYHWPQRLALLSIVPLGVLLVLYWLASGSRTRYEVPTSAPVKAVPPAKGDRTPEDHEATHDDAAPGAPVRILATPGLWGRWGLTRSMASVHFAAGLALVVLTLAWSQVFAGRAACVSPRTLFDSPECLPGGAAISEKPLFTAFVVIALLVLVATTWLIAVAQADSIGNQVPTAQSRAAVGLLIAAVALFVANTVTLWQNDQLNLVRGQLLGLRVVPTVLVTILLLIALVGLTWRGDVRWTVLAALLALGALGALAWESTTSSPGPRSAPALLTYVLFGLLFALVVLWPRGEVAWMTRKSSARVRRLDEQAWSGRGPGVFLLLALGSMMMLTGLLVVAVGDWLNGSAKPQCLDPGFASGHPATCPGPLQIQIPQTYTQFAIATAIGLVLVLVLVLFFGAAVPFLRAGVLRRTARRSSTDKEIPAPVLGRLERQKQVDDDELVPRPAGVLHTLKNRSDLKAAVARARDLAALSHRVELVLALIAISFAVAITLALLISAQWSPPSGFASLGLWATALIWVGVIARVVTTDGSAPDRPLAMIWDIVCFLPRSAHPFGPPCYAERAVPEIAARMDAWLREPAATGSTAPPRQVILSAHSMGVVLAVAALFTGERPVAGSAPDQDPGPRSRVGLLSYGSQIRPYFGRILPELFGPAVIGTPSCGPTRLSWDPWRDQLSPSNESTPSVPAPGAAPSAPPAPPDTLRSRLQPGDRPEVAWVNLWRRTDPLGFPADSYFPNVIDRGAEEIDTTAFVAVIGRHSDYPRTSAYRRALAEVRSRLGV